MNERYLFRGKDIHCRDLNNHLKWVTGSFVYKREKKGHRTDEFYFIEDADETRSSAYEVEPATIGQCTGLRDKNGELIFEGDIVRIKKGYCGNPKIKVDEYAREVVYEVRFAGYYELHDSDIYEIEVIGNIHDNPELLKGVEQ